MQENEAAQTGIPVAKKRRKSGSEKRKSGKRVTIRLTDSQHATLLQAANEIGLSVGSYVRKHLPIEPELQGRSKRSDLKAEIIRLQGYVNRVGGNVHQLLKRVNYGDIREGAEVVSLLRPMIAGYEGAVGAIMETLGRKKA